MSERIPTPAAIGEARPIAENLEPTDTVGRIEKELQLIAEAKESHHAELQRYFERLEAGDEKRTLSYAGYKLQMAQNMRIAALSHIFKADGDPKTALSNLQAEKARAKSAGNLEEVLNIERQIDVIRSVSSDKYPPEYGAEQVVHALEHSRDPLLPESSYRRAIGRTALRYLNPAWRKVLPTPAPNYIKRSIFRKRSLDTTTGLTTGVIGELKVDDKIEEGWQVKGIHASSGDFLIRAEKPARGDRSKREAIITPEEVMIEPIDEDIKSPDDLKTISDLLSGMGLSGDKLKVATDLVKHKEEAGKKLLEMFGLDDARSARAEEIITSSDIRLGIDRLIEIGLPKGERDEAHRILKEIKDLEAEKGAPKSGLKFKELQKLGIPAERVEDLRKFCRQSHHELQLEMLNKLGVPPEKAEKILAAGLDDHEKLFNLVLAENGFTEEEIGSAFSALRSYEVAEMRRSMGYDDEDLLTEAHDLGIEAANIELAHRKGIKLDTLMKARRGNKKLQDFLRMEGIIITSPVADEAPDNPYTVFNPDTEFVQISEQIKYQPAGLRRTIHYLGDKWIYEDPIRHSLLVFPNLIYRKLIGEKRLAKRNFWEERNHSKVGVRDDYNMTGYGGLKRDEALEEIKGVNKKAREAKRLLSWHTRHKIMGEDQRKARRTITDDILRLNDAHNKFDEPWD